MDATSDELYLDLLKKCLTADLYDESAWQHATQLTLNNTPVAIPPDLAVLQKVAFQPQIRESGLDWPLFGYSMIGLKRLDNIRYCIEETLRNNVPGDYIETGVWRGGATIWMRAILKIRRVSDRMVWSADSFEGLPPKGPLDQPFPTDPDHSKTEFLKVSLQQVQDNFRRFGLLDAQTGFIKGWFKDSLPNAPIKRLAVLRLDGDMYESTMDVLTSLYDRVSPGGFVIVDDYYSWAGCRKAIDDFRAQRNIVAELRPIDHDAVFWQIPSFAVGA